MKKQEHKNLKESYEDLYDEVLNHLINEGCTLDESNYIMTYIVEQGMPPQEIIGRGIAQLLFGPQSKTSSTKPKPNPYRPGATIRATGPNLDKFPELQRFAGQARKVAEPVAKTAGALSALRNITPVGIAAAVMAPRPTGDATLTAARKRGDVAPPAPKLPAPEKPKVSTRLSVKPRVLTSKPKALKSVAPEDPNLKKYDELRKTDPAAAKEFGMKIWTQKYRPVLSRPDIA